MYSPTRDFRADAPRAHWPRWGGRGCRRVVEDVVRFWCEVRQAARGRWWLRLWIPAAYTVGAVVLACPAASQVRRLAVVQAAQPWLVKLPRVPLSLLGPAQMLPLWGAVLQVAVAAGLAQLLAGWRRALVVGLLGHVVATVSAQLWITICTPVGVADHYRFMPDAGPSVAVLALAAYLAVRYRQSWLAAGLIGFEITEMILLNGLTEREHLVGLIVGAVLAAPYLGTRRTGQCPPRARARRCAGH